MSTGVPVPFTERLHKEGRGLVQASTAAGLAVRLIGGVGIRLLLDDRYPAAFERSYGDLDIITRKRDARGLEQLLAARGWEPAVAFNALNGGRRMLFNDPAGPAQVDVFVEAFEMCHRLPLAESLSGSLPPFSLPASDLLLSKLQIVALNAKDRNDSYALLLGCATELAATSALDTRRIAALAAEDWGLHHTLELNLARLLDHLTQAGLADADRATIARRVAAIQQAIEEAPKSRGWKLRARIGERRRWYEEPEEVNREA